MTTTVIASGKLMTTDGQIDNLFKRNLIVCRLKVNRRRSPQEVLDATGRKQYTDWNVVNTMPHGEGEEVEVFFFKLNRDISDDDLEREYERLGLKPDPYAQVAVNAADPTFADEKRNGIHWKDSNGRWCYAMFDRWGDERCVVVNHTAFRWHGNYWWFAGVRK